jgi:hypothetical protein
MIATATWDDPWFSDLEPDAKLLFLYLLTNRRTTAAGAFEITLRAIEFETGLKRVRVAAILDEFGDRVRWWPAHQIVWVRNFFRHQAANDNFTKSAQKVVINLPADVQAVIGLAYPILFPDGPPNPPTNVTEPLARGSDTPTEPLAYPSASNSSSNRESKSTEEGEGGNGADAPPPPPADDPPEEPKPKRATRIPDDFAITDEMRRWAIEQGSSAIQVERETEKFMDYWRAVAGSKGVKLDWPATWRNWIRRGIEDGPRGNGGLTVHHGGRNGAPGRDGRTDAERGYRLDPGPKGWSANEMAMRAIDLERSERSGT